jgi:hypothetical protein
MPRPAPVREPASIQLIHIAARMNVSSFIYMVLSFAMTGKGLYRDIGFATIHRPSLRSINSSIVCGLLCKEQGITSVIVCAAYDVVIVAGVDLRGLLKVPQSSAGPANNAARYCYRSGGRS